MKKSKSGTDAKNVWGELCFRSHHYYFPQRFGYCPWQDCVAYLGVDQFTGFMVLVFYSKKNENLELFFQTLLEWKSQGLGIKCIQDNNVGKNKIFITEAHSTI